MFMQSAYTTADKVNLIKRDATTQGADAILVCLILIAIHQMHFGSNLLLLS